MDLDLNSVFNQKLPLSNPSKVYGLGLEQCLQPKTATVKPWYGLWTWASTVSPTKNCHCQQTLVRFTDLDFNSFSDHKLLYLPSHGTDHGSGLFVMSRAKRSVTDAVC